ncbi:putative nuclease HARBI1 [Rhagoletis pomonella]|uniref:putative nuclease HARBI1 n=1 Tax=Rhagoletis pomonella TaxID=28610 RepID=UPI00177A831B|nr:putative nuclease HARBI1 [Rhagoletis pomonella]
MHRSAAIPPILKLACALRFFADVSYQRGVGNDFELGFAQATVSVVLKEVLEIFQTVICHEWINMQMTEDEKQRARHFFFRKSRITGIIGCVDGTHVGIVAPNRLKHQYLNRKGFYSLNAMIACDHNMVIRYVDGRFPGSTHDSFLWGNSELKEILQRMYCNGERSSVYLGDSGYPLSPYLMTPFRSAITGSRESTFNTQQGWA